MDASGASYSEGSEGSRLNTLRPPGAREVLRGLISIAARGRGSLDDGTALAIIKGRLVCVLSEIETVASSAAAAREAISERLAAMGGDSPSSGLQADAADLTTKVAHASSTKTAALEAEAVTLEAALDRAPAIVSAALAAESSAEASPADLESATAGLESLLPVLSSDNPLELGTLRLAAASDESSALGLRLVAPGALGPDNVTLEQPPLRGRFGSHVRLSLAINTPPAMTEGWGDEDWATALGHLASHTSVLVLLRSAMHDRSFPLTTQLCAAVGVDLASKGVVVSFDVPPDAPHPADHTAAATDVYCLLRVYGRLPSNGGAGVICVPIYKGGVSAPLILPIEGGDLMYPKPAVSGDGRIFVPAHGDIVRVWRADGKPLDGITSHGAEGLHCVAVDDEAGTLYLGGSITVALHLHDPSAPPKWVSSTAAPAGEDGGIAVLPHLGVVIVINYRTDTAWALRASDGAILHSMGGVMRAIHMCVDPSSATLFVFDSSEQSLRFRYIHGHGFEPIDDLEHSIPYSFSNFHPAAWMPATPGHPACLVVGTWGRSEVLVLGLPDCKLLRRHELRHGDRGGEICVRGLAGDPSGCALVVCDEDQRVLALPWPSLRLSLGSSA